MVRRPTSASSEPAADLVDIVRAGNDEAERGHERRRDAKTRREADDDDDDDDDNDMDMMVVERNGQEEREKEKRD